MEHEHEMSGAGPTRILALEEGDQAGVPHEVEEDLRRPMGKRPSRFTLGELLEQFRNDYEACVADRLGCLKDWEQIHPELAVDLVGIALEVENGPKPLPVVVAPAPEEIGEPTPGAFAVLALTAALVSMRAALRAFTGETTP